VSAEFLREAASLMRERAAAATPGPWLAATGSGPKRRKQQVALLGVESLRGQGEKGCLAVFAGLNEHRADDAEHAASWHPSVAPAVADWLDDVAQRWKFPALAYNDSDHALAVASAYLGRQP
jgi:hypothetical protein